MTKSFTTILQLFKEIALHFPKRKFIPPLFNLFLDNIKPLRIVICGGEKWSFSLGDKALRKLNIDLYNGYDPTEASVGVAYWKFDRNYANQLVPNW